MDFNPLQFCHIEAQDAYLWSVITPSRSLLNSLDMTLVITENLLVVWYVKMIKIHLVQFLPQT
jgi:hypothetical protein